MCQTTGWLAPPGQLALPGRKQPAACWDIRPGWPPSPWRILPQLAGHLIRLPPPQEVKEERISACLPTGQSPEIRGVLLHREPPGKAWPTRGLAVWTGCPPPRWGHLLCAWYLTCTWPRRRAALSALLSKGQILWTMHWLGVCGRCRPQNGGHLTCVGSAGTKEIGKEISIESGIFLFGRLQLLEKEAEGLPAILARLPLLQARPHVHCRGVNYQSEFGPTARCVAKRRACLSTLKAVSMDSNHNSFSFPFLLSLSSSVNGHRVRAIPGKNLLYKFIMPRNAWSSLTTAGQGNSWIATTWEGRGRMPAVDPTERQIELGICILFHNGFILPQRVIWLKWLSCVCKQSYG